MKGIHKRIYQKKEYVKAMAEQKKDVIVNLYIKQRYPLVIMTEINQTERVEDVASTEEFGVKCKRKRLRMNFFVWLKSLFKTFKNLSPLLIYLLNHHVCTQYNKKAQVK